MTLFDEGELPSEFEEAQDLPSVRRLLADQVDMQFADMRALLLLPRDDVYPGVGANFTMASMLFGQISGFSIWFYNNRHAMKIAKREPSDRPHSRKRFLGFVRAYYPRSSLEPTLPTIATRLYAVRNVLSHNLGIENLAPGRPAVVNLRKPDPPLAPDEIVQLEIHRSYPFEGAPVRRTGSVLTVDLPGVYWAVGRMLRASLLDEPARCEERARQLVDQLPKPTANDG